MRQDVVVSASRMFFTPRSPSSRDLDALRLLPNITPEHQDTPFPSAGGDEKKMKKECLEKMAEEDLYHTYLTVAKEAALQAGDVILKAFYSPKSIEHKGAVDLVTATDKEAGMCCLLLFSGRNDQSCIYCRESSTPTHTKVIPNPQVS